MATDSSQQLSLPFPTKNLPTDWKISTVGACCIAVNDGDWIETKDQGGGDYRLLQVSNIGLGVFRETGNYRYITQATFDRLSCREVLPGHILVARMPDPTGRAWLVTRMAFRAITAVDVAILEPNDAVIDGRYLAYYLNSQYNLRHANARAGGTTRERITRKDLAAFPLPLPPLPIQRRIAGILSAYDELIENSQRRIKILESMARALYREALGAINQAATSRPIVDSPFWRFISENVSNYVGTKRYYATADIEGLAVTGAGIDYSFADKPSRAQKQPIPNSVWFARMKETYKIAWYGPRNDDRVSGIVLSSGFAGFEARDAELWPLLFLAISSKEFHVQKDLYCTGATQMSLTNEGMARIMLPIPDEESARRLGRDAGPMLDAIASLQSRNNNLRRTRDLLLSRLISGELDVEASAA